LAGFLYAVVPTMLYLGEISMGAFRFPVSPSVAIAEFFADIPPAVKSYMRQGFVVLSRIAPNSLPRVVEIAAQSVQNPSTIEEDQVAKELGLQPDEARALLSAVSLLTAVSSVRKDKPDEIVGAAAAASLIPEDSRRAALAFCSELLPQKEALKQTFDTSRLATRLLPALALFETVVDIRLGFRDSSVELSVPVVLVHIDTDASDAEIWFQMQKADVEKIIQDLGKVLSQLSQAEKWSERPAKD
jgi:hypothetical protein